MDDSNLKNAYANFCNVSSTREEVVLIFGINQAWERSQREVQIQLTDRVILSPFAAKRLADLLTNVVREYEARFGALCLPADSRRQRESRGARVRPGQIGGEIFRIRLLWRDDGKEEHQAGAGGLGVLGPDQAVMRVQDALGDGQAQSPVVLV